MIVILIMISNNYLKKINEKDEIKANYKSVLEEKGIKDIINNLINMDINIGIPIFLLNFLKVGL